MRHWIGGGPPGIISRIWPLDSRRRRRQLVAAPGPSATSHRPVGCRRGGAALLLLRRLMSRRRVASVYDHILIRLQRRYGRGKKQLPAADRGGERAGRRPSCRSSGGAYAPIQRGVERAQDERSAGRPPLQMKGRPLTLRTCSASEQHSVGPPQRRARPSRLKGVLEARGAAGLEQGVALRRLQLDELDLGRQRRDLCGHQNFTARSC